MNYHDAVTHPLIKYAFSLKTAQEVSQGFSMTIYQSKVILVAYSF